MSEVLFEVFTAGAWCPVTRDSGPMILSVRDAAYFIDDGGHWTDLGWVKVEHPVYGAVACVPRSCAIRPATPDRPSSHVTTAAEAAPEKALPEPNPAPRKETT